jgi:hypothetical protein
MITRIVYWAAVMAISLALVIGLILFFEARDGSSLDEGSAVPAPALTAT